MGREHRAGQIPSFDLKRNYVSVGHEIKEAINRVLESQNFILGPEVDAFEREMEAYLGVPHAVTCASGTDSLLLGLMALGVGPGDEVLTTPFSFFATAGSIARLGAKPVFADVDPDTYNIDMNLAKEALSPKTKAFIPVHIFGQLCRLEEITDELKEGNVTLLEDCAQAIGAHRMHNGRIVKSGGWGGMGGFSFFPTKNLGAYGDAGMTTCWDAELTAEIVKLRVHGAEKTYMHDEVGINSRMDALQAAILRVRLAHLEEWIENRREVARRYKLLFAERGLIEEIKIPAEDGGNRHTYHQYVVRAKRRDDLQKFLSERGVATRVYYPLSLHLQPCFSYLGYKKGDMPVSEKLCEEVLALPMFPELTAEEQERVVRAIADFYGM